MFKFHSYNLQLKMFPKRYLASKSIHLNWRYLQLNDEKVWNWLKKQWLFVKWSAELLFWSAKVFFWSTTPLLFFYQQELFFWSASFFILCSRINILVSKNLNEIKTKFLKGKFTSKCEIFLIRLDFPFPKDKK